MQVPKDGKAVGNVAVHPPAVAPAVTSPQLFVPVTRGSVPQEVRAGGVLVEVMVPLTVRAVFGVVVPMPSLFPTKLNASVSTPDIALNILKAPFGVVVDTGFSRVEASKVVVAMSGIVAVDVPT